MKIEYVFSYTNPMQSRRFDVKLMTLEMAIEEIYFQIKSTNLTKYHAKKIESKLKKMINGEIIYTYISAFIKIPEFELEDP